MRTVKGGRERESSVAIDNMPVFLSALLSDRDVKESEEGGCFGVHLSFLLLGIWSSFHI